jgi:hypothetical protein
MRRIASCLVRGVDRQFQAGDAGGVGERLPVISGRGRNQWRRLTIVPLDHREHGIQRAANLERKRRLQCFELEEDVAAAQPREPV